MARANEKLMLRRDDDLATRKGTCLESGIVW